ncbi:MAG: ECF transporter S component [Candidatus Hodarchaeales archaeon]
MNKPDIDSINGNSSFYFQTVDLVIIALFASLGGVSSSFIGNIGRSFFAPILPGGGQILSGLHIFWLVMVFLLTNQKIGSVMLTGIIKGFVELFAGNTLGIIVVFVAFGEALVFELSYLVITRVVSSTKFKSIIISVSAGFSAPFYIVFKFETFVTKYISQGLPEVWIIIVTGISFVSGVILGGFMALTIFDLMDRSGLMDWRLEKNSE